LVARLSARLAHETIHDSKADTNADADTNSSIRVIPPWRVVLGARGSGDAQPNAGQRHYGESNHIQMQSRQFI
jgi:hypothetical protein